MRGYYDRRGIPKKSKTEEQKKRSNRLLIFYVIAAVCVLASYPVGNVIYNQVVVESDKELNVLPNWLLELVPDGLLGTLM